MIEKIFVRAEARRRGDGVAEGLLPSIIANDFCSTLTRTKQPRAAGAITSSPLLLRASAPPREQNPSSLRVFAPSRESILQRAAA
ncbi:MULTISPECIES: hypothetical protein [unclassified Sphingomonas]|uniref:hypothetical protein n=1 Tax=unclassified Sphingomonas TaxID=196159 RepID=UPI0025D091C7|nr:MULTISPECIES: hypothetical protein [unclassified Sphingomonas]